MKRLIAQVATAAIFALAASAVYAAREMSIGDYSNEVRTRVVAKMREALSANGGVAEVSGTVTFAGWGYFFLQRDNDGLKVFCNGRLPSVGDVVTVEGSPSLEGGRVVLVAKKWEKTSTAPLPAARPILRDELVESSGGGLNWLRVALAGRVIGETENGFAMSIEGVPVNVVAKRLPGFLSDAGVTHPKVTVRGVIELLLDQASLIDGRGGVIGVKVDVSSPDDIAIVPDVEYFARRNGRLTMFALIGFAAVLAAALAIFGLLLLRQRARLFKSRTIMEERRRMADDLHDTIEQHLAGAGIMLKLGRVKEAQDALVRAKRETRDVVWGLKNDDMMRLSPADMLRRLAHDETAKGLCRVEVRPTCIPQSLDAAQMRDLSLIVREAIGNAVKHGGARKVAITSDPDGNGGWILRIANNGALFNPSSVPGAAEGHFGLEGMRRRALRLGATVSFAPRKGWMVVELKGKKA